MMSINNFFFVKRKAGQLCGSFRRAAPFVEHFIILSDKIIESEVNVLNDQVMLILICECYLC